MCDMEEMGMSGETVIGVTVYFSGCGDPVVRSTHHTGGHNPWRPRAVNGSSGIGYNPFPTDLRLGWRNHMGEYAGMGGLSTDACFRILQFK